MKGNKKKILIVLISVLFITLTATGQNLFFIDENSYPCTESFALQSNLDDGEDLNVLFAKDGATPIIGVTTKSSLPGTLFSGKLIIYLDDGTVITCMDRGESYYVDDTAQVVYSLTNEQVNKMKNSNINTVRYTLKIYDIKEVNRSASNKAISTKGLIAKFYNNLDSINEVAVKKEQNPRKTKLDALMGGLNNEQGQSNGDSYATSYYGSPESGNGSDGYGLSGRSLVSKGKVQQECNEEGRVVVRIVVDRTGVVISATPGVKGTTNNNPCLLDPAKKTAFMHKWNTDFNAPSQQIGFVVVNYTLGE
ncbi:hypothetical protein Q4603_10740 [Zobellia galactanivorans]|uniref:hypothetical protein n=1 Tax=Zobellia galactanivorans (strain DSM 12802 / CCUG 47099 / CIP 106680 / NCIMB 13871 / Dsij) TaxID=63186 RepID=UPI0026E425D8|nr:hypothetical protein [Zobellia galactanivorans]MDO6809093.1 hypothetical protein [Zobellia galactanivorans]